MARQLAVILRNIRDPRLDSCLVSVTSVDTKPDLRFAKIYYSVINYDKTLSDAEKDEQVQEALESLPAISARKLQGLSTGGLRRS